MDQKPHVIMFYCISEVEQKISLKIIPGVQKDRVRVFDYFRFAEFPGVGRNWNFNFLRNEFIKIFIN